MSAVHALFIGQTRLKEDTPLSGSVDDKLIAPTILLAQRKYILPILGTKLYDKLSADIKSGISNVTGVYKILIEDYIQQPLIYFTFAELLPLLRVRFVNNATTIMNSEQSTGATYEDLKPIIDKYIDMGQFERQRLIDYLCDNTASYPEYSANTGSDLDPTSNNYYPGLNIDTTVVENDLQLKSILQAVGIKTINYD